MSSIKNIKNAVSICLISASLAFAHNLDAQPKEGKSLDKILAIVGKEIIMQSEIDQNIAMMAQQQANVKFDDVELREKVLEELINNKLLITKAIEDSIVVSDEEIAMRWNEVINSMIRQYGSEKRIEEVLGKPLSRVKVEYSDVIKNKILYETLIRNKFSTVTTSNQEVIDFYNMYKDSMEMVPPKVALYHIVKNVKINNQTKVDVFELAKKVRDSIVSGADFAELAKRYSGDPGSASTGGDLGWFEKGKLIPEFEKAAMALQKGETSLPILTPFGYHVIQTIDKKPTALNTRHILFKLDQSNDDKENTIKELNTIVEQFKAGESFSDLARKNSDDKETKGFGGLLGKLALNEIPSNLQETVSSMKVGDISAPTFYGIDPTKPAYHIIYKKEFIPEHKATLEDDFKTIENMCLNFKRQKLVKDLLVELKSKIYWEIKK